MIQGTDQSEESWKWGKIGSNMWGGTEKGRVERRWVLSGGG